MGRVIDIVPNHMGVAGANRSWLDMLETGPQAPSARFFDVDWDPVRGELHGRVLLPLLEDLYGKVLEAGLITLERDGGSFWIRYRDHRLPLHPRSYEHVLGRREAEFRRAVRGRSRRRRGVPQHPRLGPAPADARRAGAGEGRGARPREGGHQAAARPPLRREPPDSRVPRCQRRLLSGERRGPRQLRRAPRAPGGAGLPARLLAGRVRGDQLPPLLRRDRAGGPADGGPARLRRGPRADLPVGRRGGRDRPPRSTTPTAWRTPWAISAGCRRASSSRPAADVWSPEAAATTGRASLDPIRARYRAALAQDPDSPLARRFPVVAEKILSRGELLPADWPIDGTVGYEFLNALNGVFIDRAGSATIEDDLQDVHGGRPPRRRGAPHEQAAHRADARWPAS